MRGDRHSIIESLATDIFVDLAKEPTERHWERVVYYLNLVWDEAIAHYRKEEFELALANL